MNLPEEEIESTRGRNGIFQGKEFRYPEGDKQSTRGESYLRQEEIEIISIPSSLKSTREDEQYQRRDGIDKRNKLEPAE